MENIFLLVGPSGAGKSYLGEKIVKIFQISVIDLDKLFEERFSSIRAYGSKFGWRNFFEKESELFRNVFNDLYNSQIKSLLITGGGTLYHPNYQNISAKNYDFIKNKCKIIYLTSSINYSNAANSAIANELKRSYMINFKKKKELFIKQSQFYESISNYTLYNDNNTDDFVYELAKILTKNA